MKNQKIKADSDISDISTPLSKEGFTKENLSIFLDENKTKHLAEIQKAFNTDLEYDPEPGSRLRAFAEFRYCNGTLKYISSKKYCQPKEFNNDAGGYDRQFKLLSPEFIASSLISGLLAVFVSVAKHQLPTLFKNPDGVKVQIHAVRYLSKDGVPSFSSPFGVHTDNEDLVMVTLVNKSSNLKGALNNIWEKSEHLGRLIPKHTLELTYPLDSMFLRAGVPHDVGIIASSDFFPSYRDILIVTAQPA